MGLANGRQAAVQLGSAPVAGPTRPGKIMPRLRLPRLRWLLLLAVVAAGVWAAHGAPVTWSLLVVALGLLLLGAAKRPAPSPSW